MFLYYETSNHLIHYGVKGMRWGVRRYQNEDGSLTAAGKKRQDKRDRRAAKYYERANASQREIDKLNKSLKSTDNHPQRRKLERDIKKLEKDRDRNQEIAETKEQGKLTKKQKAALIGATVVAAYATYKFVDSGSASRLVAKGKFVLGMDDLGFKKNSNLANPDMDADEIMSSVVSRINPGYGGVGTKNNCRRCTFAYEMSRRGYDVKATKTINGTGQTAAGLHNATSKNKQNTASFIWNQTLKEVGLNKSFDTKLKAFSSFKDVDKIGDDSGYTSSIFNALSKQPNGARGELNVSWSAGGGHSMAWEIVNNKPVIFDCQTGSKYDSVSAFDVLGSQVKRAGYSRLDNIELNEDFLLRWLQNA